MRLSTDKISHLAHLLTDAVEKQNLVTFSDKVRARNAAKDILTKFCQLDEEVDEVVRKRLASYSRNIMEGSREWDVMYRKHFNEEMRKRWH